MKLIYMKLGIEDIEMGEMLKTQRNKIQKTKEKKRAVHTRCGDLNYVCIREILAIQSTTTREQARHI